RPWTEHRVSESSGCEALFEIFSTTKTPSRCSPIVAATTRNDRVFIYISYGFFTEARKISRSLNSHVPSRRRFARVHESERKTVKAQQVSGKNDQKAIVQDATAC